MATIPNTIKTAITGSVSVMLASLALPQTNVDAAFAAFFDELNGAGTRSLTNPHPLDRLLSRRQVAELLNCSRVSVSRYVKAGKLRAVYGGNSGKVLSGISEASVRAFIEGKEA